MGFLPFEYLHSDSGPDQNSLSQTHSVTEAAHGFDGLGHSGGGSQHAGDIQSYSFLDSKLNKNGSDKAE